MGKAGGIAEPLLRSESTKLTVTWEDDEEQHNQADENADEENDLRKARRTVPLSKRSLNRLLSNPNDELQRFRLSLFWMGLDQSTTLRIAFSWILFILLALLIPLVNIFAVSCTDCYSSQIPFERIVNVSESALAILSFACLSFLLRNHGLRKVLLLEKLDRESLDVQQGYKAKVNFASLLMAMIILPSLVVKLVREIWWYSCVSVKLPWVPQSDLLNVFMCVAVMASWLYKAGVFLLMCVLFRLMCSLQILRLQSYNKLLEESLEAPMLLLEHVRIRKQLYKISHRCRFFVVSSMFIITTSQFVSLLFILSFKESVHFFRAGGLAVCSAVQLSGFLICMNGASKITHRAQNIVSLVSEWHAVWTCSSMTTVCSDVHNGAVKRAPSYPLLRTQSDITALEVFSVKSEQSHYINEFYFKQQQAFSKYQTFAYLQNGILELVILAVTYLQHNSAGISLYGFVLDRGFLYTIFGLEFSLVLWILGKTVTGIH